MTYRVVVGLGALGLLPYLEHRSLLGLTVRCRTTNAQIAARWTMEER